MVFSKDDKVLIKSLYKVKGYKHKLPTFVGSSTATETTFGIKIYF